MSVIRIATRASQLALWQAHHVADLLKQQHPDVETELIDITTSGDQNQSQPLRELGGTGVFTREVQRALLDDRADLAVHSLKDLPTEIIEPKLTLACVTEREVRWDALVLPVNGSLKPDAIDPEDPLAIFPEGARIGTGSLRRQAQLLSHRPDLQLLEIRGNVNTRLRKLDDGEYDAIILASAGLIRLKMEDRLSCLLQPPIMYPAIGQAALGLECRADDSDLMKRLKPLIDPVTFLETTAERAMLSELRAGCHAPVGAHCHFHSDHLILIGTVLSADGQQEISVTNHQEIPIDNSDTSRELAESLGRQVAGQLLADGAESLISGE